MTDAEKRPAKRRYPADTIMIIAGVLLVAVILLIAALLFFTPTRVPDVMMRPVEQATQLIEASGLKVGERSEVATTRVGPGLVADQDPAPNASARRRSAVDLTVSVAPVAATVPKIVGLESAAASDTLTAGLFVPVRVDEFDLKAPVGTVVSQVPTAGADWMTGRPVGFVVSVGPDDGTGVAVPNIVGLVTDKALVELQKVGLVGYGIVASPAQVSWSVVTRQAPEPGTMLRPGTTVLFYLEPGPR